MWPFMIGLFCIVNFLYFFMEMPVLAFGFIGWSNLIIAWGILLMFISAMILLGKFRQFVAKTAWGEMLKKVFPQIFQERVHIVDIADYQNNGKNFKKYKAIGIVGIIFLVIGMSNLLVFPILTSAPILYSNSYRSLLGEVKESSFTVDVEPINLSQIRIVDEETARKLADKKIGEVPALGSEVQLGELSLQKVQNKLYYVAPLEHRGIFQWLTNYSKGSKGYVMVSATNPQDVRLIQDVNGQEVHLKYQMKGFLFDYLPRYLYFHGLFNIGISDFSFEVDDDLNPYWVVTLYKNKIGYHGSDAVGAVTVNAQTGEIIHYTLENIPRWIDRIQPEDFIYRQIRDWGEYINGFWNSIFAKTGTLKPTGNELHLIYGNDDNVYWYTGITSSGKDGSSVGFIMVNSRTKEAKWYKVSGADEAGAKKSAEGQVQEKGYRSGYPILYNIGGVPTYISPMKDKEGLLKAVAFISVENYNLVGVGPDIESGLRIYQQVLASKGNQFIPSQELKPIRLQGKLSRVSHVVKGGESYFYFMVEGDNRIFIGNANNSPKVPLAKVGDIVVITANDTKENVLNISDFKGENY
ncbi:hypothetical protein [Pelosinus sp. sgz500959]|uniref:hypothetical protein n=1 Tax=Pelosinus sp. sgz500959 TaxID=3242472 RepID=UPI00366F9286